MNHQSSRGHMIVTVIIERGDETKSESKSRTEVHCVDLAGRENERTTSVTGERLVELSFINKSLFHLSQCIRGLGGEERRRKDGASTARFRNSRLTLVLSSALQGSAKTAMIATLSPAVRHYEENLT